MGSTFEEWPTGVGSRDHPHIHGEHDKAGGSFVARLGSPPYTWGAQFHR